MALSRSRRVVRAFAALGVLALACAAPRVESESRAGVDLARYDGTRVELVPALSVPEISTDPGLAAALVRTAEESLRSKGYRVLDAGDAPLRIFIVPTIEDVLRRTFSSDPDQAATRVVPRQDIVVVVRIVDRAAGHDVWRSLARVAIPQVELDFLRSRRDLWLEAVEAAFRALDAAESGL